ncbi:unnamed protein product, partial [Phaeothamnion confervicola]
LPPLPLDPADAAARAARWRDLARKHGAAPEALGAVHTRLRRELDDAVAAAAALPAAAAEEAVLRGAAAAAAAMLSAARRRAATDVAARVNAMLPELGMEGATLAFADGGSVPLTLYGADRVDVLLSAAAGAPFRPVEAGASSGEKSRLLLLLETCLPPPAPLPVAADADAETDGFLSVNGGSAAVNGASQLLPPPLPPVVVVYDEIDAHMGGRAAAAVGRLLSRQGRTAQVVVVTHAAPVAALADQHIVVHKMTATAAAPQSGMACDAAGGGDVVGSGAAGGVVDVGIAAIHGGYGGIEVTVREVRGTEREAEVARMAGGGFGGDIAEALARSMI